MVIGGPGAAGVTARKYVEEENLELGPVLMEAINVMDSVKIAGPANLKNTHMLVSHRMVKLFTWKMKNSLEDGTTEPLTNGYRILTSQKTNFLMLMIIGPSGFFMIVELLKDIDWCA